MMKLSEKLLRITDVCELLGVKKSTVYDWLDPKSARFKVAMPRPLKIGAATRWRTDELLLWVETLSDERAA